MDRMGQHDWQSSRKIKLLFRKTVVIVILIILIAGVIILFNNFDTQTTTGNKTTVDEKLNNGLTTIQNNSISKNIPDFIFKSKYVTTYLLPNDT